MHLINLGPVGSDAEAAADALYAELLAAGVEVLDDDRDRSPGIKLNDADLLGLPLRLTVARRGLAQNAVEFVALRTRASSIPDPMPSRLPSSKSLRWRQRSAQRSPKCHSEATDHP